MSSIIVCFFSYGIENIKENIFSNMQEDIVQVKEQKNNQKKDLNKGITEEEIEEVLEADNEQNVEEVSQSNIQHASFSEVDIDGTVEAFDWYIEIPKIKVYAPIEEGIDEDILNRSVGHFEDTSRKNGNCGLAAHNRGYRVNYFARLKELEKQDIIYYFVDGRKYQYQITDILIIYETDWSMLEDTEDNRITLITCVENREEYRLCIQGVLIEE